MKRTERHIFTLPGLAILAAAGGSTIAGGNAAPGIGVAATFRWSSASIR